MIKSINNRYDALRKQIWKERDTVIRRVKKMTCLFLAVLMLTSAFNLHAAAAEATDFERIDSPMIENTTDSSRLPGYTGDLSDVYGQVDTSAANEITSMFSDEAWDRFSNDMDRMLAFEPVEDSAVAPVLGNVEKFLRDGGLSSYLQSGSLLAGSEIGLQKNREDKVKVLGADANASAWVFVVDKDALCFIVKDQDGEGIPNAQVTISYLDDTGKRSTKSVVASAGHTPGIAVFDEIPKAFFGLVDIQAEGYRAVSVLDKDMKAGDHYTYVLEKSKANELYIRGIDLSGKDLVNEDTDLSLMSSDTGNLALKVIVSKTGNASFPNSIDVYSANRDKTVLTVSSTSGYTYDANTRVYTAEKRWVEKNAGLLQDGDQISVKFGGSTFALEHLTVKDAVFEPGTRNLDMPVTAKPMPGNISDRLGGSGILNTTAQILQVPVTIGFFPDGNMILMASYDITNLDKNTKYKYSSLFKESWNPKMLETSESALEVFERSYWENAKKVKGGEEVLNSPDKIKCLTNKNYNFSMSFSVFLRSCYNEETKDSYGTGGLMFSGSLSGGITEYFLFTVGPVVIPAYVGFEAGIAINSSLNVNFEMDKPPVGEENDTKWKYASNGDSDLTARIEFIVSFSVFGGIGVKGVLGAGATGYANLDIATVLGKGKASIFTADPHSFIDVLYGLRINYYLLFYSGTINLECLNGAERLYDSNGEKDRVYAQALSEMEFSDLDLEACADRLVPVLNESGEPRDQAFLLEDGDETLEGDASTVNIDVSTYPDNQVQFAATKNCTALFRIASNGKRTFLLYQLQDRETGNLSSMFYMVELPVGESRSVSEFAVVPNKTNPDDPKYCDKVYIGAILADNSLTDESDRIRSTDVAAMVVDLSDRVTTSSVIASDPADHGQYLYSAPMPAGREDYCAVAYAQTALKEDNGSSVDSLKALMGVIPSYTNYALSYCEPGAPETRFHKILGREKIHSSGAIAPNEPSFWAVDPMRSSDKWLVVKGYGSNGYYDANDPRCAFRADIDGLVDIEDIISGTADFDSLVTNWQYLNGANYFIAGDSVYWMTREATGSDADSYRWTVEKVGGGSGIVSADNRYAMITNNDQSAIYLVGVIEDYDVDVEKGTAAKAANRAQIHTIIAEKDRESGKTSCNLHGPLTINFARGEIIHSFTAAYNPEASQASGLTVVYTAPNDDTGSSRTRMWKQNASRGLLVTDVKIPNYLIKEGEPYIEVYVTVRNYGYGRENPIPYTVHDENGVSLMQCINGRDVGETFYTGTDLYTGDSRVDKLEIRPNPDWKLNAEHEIVIEPAGSYRYDGDLDDIVNSAAVRANNTSLSAENILIDGRHYISTSITNNTIIGAEMPAIRAVFHYADGSREREMTFHLPAGELLYRYDAEDAELAEQIYHFDIDMDAIWEQGLDEGLLGISLSLVNAAGEQTSNDTVYLTNPAEKPADTVPADDPSPLEPIGPDQVLPPAGDAASDHDCPSARFADFDPNAWYHEAVDYAVTNGLMNGAASDRFDPDGITTRAMLVTLLYRLEKEPAVSGRNPFDDVENGRWYTDAVIWANDNGIVTGYGDGRFGPMDPITREQFAAILFRYAENRGYDTSKAADLSGYEDASSISPWALDAMKWANAERLITGRTATLLIPGGNTTRAEAAAILMRFIEKTK